MKKDDALALRERLRTLAGTTSAKLGLGPLEDDGKLFHDEVDGTARWAQRLALKDAWPHGGPAHTSCPGLRYEVWFFADKREEILLLALCSPERGLDGLCAHLAPTFKTLVEGGKYARRYQPIDAPVRRFYPDAEGICRRVPLAKAAAGLEQLLDDTLKPIDGAFHRWEGAEGANLRFIEACEAYDPLAALKNRFG